MTFLRPSLISSNQKGNTGGHLNGQHNHRACEGNRLVLENI